MIGQCSLVHPCPAPGAASRCWPHCCSPARRPMGKRFPPHLFRPPWLRHPSLQQNPPRLASPRNLPATLPGLWGPARHLPIVPPAPGCPPFRYPVTTAPIPTARSPAVARPFCPPANSTGSPPATPAAATASRPPSPARPRKAATRCSTRSTATPCLRWRPWPRMH